MNTTINEAFFLWNKQTYAVEIGTASVPAEFYVSCERSQLKEEK